MIIHYDYRQRYYEIVKCIYLEICKYYKTGLNDKIKEHEGLRLPDSENPKICTDNTIKIRHNIPSIYVIHN